MKVAIVALLLVRALAIQARPNLDWSKITPLHPQRLPNPKLPIPNEEVLNSRIVGGVEAEKNSFPHQVALFIRVGALTYFCGGSLISKSYVLTAAHCVDKKYSQIEVILGAHNIRQIEETQLFIIAHESKIHEDFIPDAFINDLALIKLPSPVSFNEVIAPIKLASRSQVNEDFADLPALVSGWGYISDQSGQISNTLNYAISPVVNNTYCNDKFLGAVVDSHICIDGEHGKGTCNGDSGGPLVHKGRQIGIVSFGVIYGCQAGWPCGLTRITSFLDWIEANTDVKIDE